jgi:ABC-type spermidine/putrescine transport system permease subunit I
VSVLLLGGSDTLILPLLIYQQVLLINNNFAAALGTALLAISLILLYVQARAFRTRVFA